MSMMDSDFVGSTVVYKLCELFYLKYLLSLYKNAITFELGFVVIRTHEPPYVRMEIFVEVFTIGFDGL